MVGGGCHDRSPRSGAAAPSRLRLGQGFSSTPIEHPDLPPPCPPLACLCPAGLAAEGSAEVNSPAGGGDDRRHVVSALVEDQSAVVESGRRAPGICGEQEQEVGSADRDDG